METKRYKKKDVEQLKTLLKQGQVFAFPTDTVFGVGCSINDEQALQWLKDAKQRDKDKPIPIMVGSKQQIQELAYVDERACKLIDAFMPGALTLILKKKESVASYISDGRATIAIRMPNDDFLLQLLKLEPLLVSSANLSGEQPKKTSDEVYEILQGRIHGVVEGEAQSDAASTIVDLTTSCINVIREGEISQMDITKTLGGSMKVALASDHGGYRYKEIIKASLIKDGFEVDDFGCHSSQATDYPDMIYPAVQSVANKQNDRAIVICGTGIGVSIVANKVNGIRCANVNDMFSAKVTREHNDSNVLALGERILGESVLMEIVNVWLHTEFSGMEKHKQRIDKITDIELKEKLK